jgi:hypothetical protein
MSVVIESAIAAFHNAVVKPANQPLLASLRKYQQVLFADLTATLSELPRAPDLLVHGEAIGQPYLLTNEVLERWLCRWPKGVIWPITVAASVVTGEIAAPLRLLLMVPMGTPTSGLDVPRGLARWLSDAAWPDRSEEAFGKRAALFLGMYADSRGHWEFGPVALWTLPGSDGTAVSRGLPLIPEIVQAMAGESFDPDAVRELASEYMADEIGMVSNSNG